MQIVLTVFSTALVTSRGEKAFSNESGTQLKYGIFWFIFTTIVSPANFI